MPYDDTLTDTIKSLARESGFVAVGVAAADDLPGGDIFRHWLDHRYEAGMSYMRRNEHKRFSPKRLVPGAKSVISLAVSYADPHRNSKSNGIALYYARGRDYHKVLKTRCRELMDKISRAAPQFSARAFVDTGPLNERSAAAAAGIGWIGRNGCLIVPDVGSYVFLCEIVCNLPLRTDSPIESACNGCDKCMRACPTGAFVAPGLIDAAKCITYMTVEHRGHIGPEHRRLIGHMVFGCDKCQEVCPHNSDIPPGDEELTTLPGSLRLQNAHLKDILTWDRRRYARAVRGTAVKRAKYEMFMRNAAIAAGNSHDASLVGPLKSLSRRLGQHLDVVEWAIKRLSEK